MRGEEAKPLIFIATYVDRVMKVGSIAAALAMARLLVEKWGVRMPRVTDEISFFHLALKTCNMPLVDYYLTASGVSVDARDPSGQTALHYVCIDEDLSDANSHTLARFLVEIKGADPTLLNEGFPAAQYARWQSKIRTSQYLSQCGKSSGRSKKGRKKDKVFNAQQTKASVEAAAEAARQAAERARLAEESLLAELEAEEEAAKQAKIEKKKKKEGKKSKKGQKKMRDAAGAEELMGSLVVAGRGEDV
jgi:hypothetical protein